MALQQALDANIKVALLAGKKFEAEVLKSLKSALQYEAVALKLPKDKLTDDQIIAVFTREAKKRAETAELYKNAGETQRAETELSEKAIIDSYLPQQLDDTALEQIVNEAIAAAGDNAQLGQVIGVVRAKAGASADGGRIAALVKAKLNPA